MPEWRNLIWSQSTWGDPASPNTNAYQEVFGGYMPWLPEGEQLQTAQRTSRFHVYALDGPDTKNVVAEIHGIDPNASLTKQIREGIVEEQKVSLSITDPGWAEYYLYGAGSQYIKQLKYIRIEQNVSTAQNNLTVPIGLFRVSSIPQSSDDGQGVSISFECEDWLASNLRTPFPDGANPYETLITNFEGSLDIDEVPKNVIPGVEYAPQGVSQERLDLGNSIFGVESNWFHNFFGYIWNFMMDLCDENIIVDKSVITAAKNASKIKVSSPELLGFSGFTQGIAAGGGETTQTPGVGGIGGAMEASLVGNYASQFGILAFVEGPSAIAYLKELMSYDGTLSSHSGIKGTYFVYDKDGKLHWRSWQEIFSSDLVFSCGGGTARGKLSVPVERLETTVSEPAYNHFKVVGSVVPFVKKDGYLEPPILPAPEGMNIYGELLDGYIWTQSSTISRPSTSYVPLEIPPGGIDFTFTFQENFGGGGVGSQRPFDPAFVVAPTGSIIGAAFFTYSESDLNLSGVYFVETNPTEIARTADDVTYHFNNTLTIPVYLTGYHLTGTVWAPESLWDEPDQADFDVDDVLNEFMQTTNSPKDKTFEDYVFQSRWYTYPGLRDRTLTIYNGEDYAYVTMPSGVTERPPDPRVLNGQLAVVAKERLNSAIKFYCGPGYKVNVSLDSAFAFTEMGSTLRIDYPPENINGYFRYMSANIPFSEQAQSWELQWIEDA